MARTFKTVDYEQSGKQTVTIDDCLPANHLARFIAGGLHPDHDTIAAFRKTFLADIVWCDQRSLSDRLQGAIARR